MSLHDLFFLLTVWSFGAAMLLLLLPHIVTRYPGVAYAWVRAMYYGVPVMVGIGFLRTWLGMPAPVVLEASFLLEPVTVLPPSSTGATLPWRTVFMGFWLTGAGVGLVRLGIQVYRLQQVLASLQRIASIEMVESWRRRMGIRRCVRMYVGSSSPFSGGVLQPFIVLPMEVLQRREVMHMIVLHELEHIRRWDFLAQMVEALIAAGFWWHPLIHLLKRRIDLLREVTCDQVVVHEYQVSRKSYATVLLESLLQEAHVLPVLSSYLRHPSTLKTRIEAMMHARTYIRHTSWFFILATAGLIFFGACTDVARESVAPEITTEVPPPKGDVFVVVEEMPELIGGMQAIAEKIHYPETARKAGVEGTVIVQFVVDENGKVQNPVIVKGVGAGLDEEALRVVRQLTFKPGKQRGRPVKVRMALPIRFELEGKADTAKTASVAPEVDSMPEVLGGFTAIAQRIHYPEVAKKAGVEGTVIVQFVVDEKGRVREPRVIQGAGAGLDEEALRVVRTLRFRPAKKDGKPVPVQIALPIQFKLPDKGGA